MDINSPLLYIAAGLGLLCLIPLLNVCLYRVYTGLRRMADPEEPAESSSSCVPLSVVITAHNMAEHLRKNLPVILEQNYAQFEVIVVNDASTDDTEDVLKLLEQKYNNLYHTFTPATSKYMSHKKLALTLGIRAAKYEWLVFTEADCVPAGPDWLHALSRHFVEGVNIVIGYTNYMEDDERPHFSSRIRFDRLYTQMYQLYQACHYRAIEADGCNLAYRKSFFTANKGFSSHLNLLRGGQELFVNDYAQYQEGTRVVLSPESFMTQSCPYPSSQWREDKVFHMETQRNYAHKFNAKGLFIWNMMTVYLAWIAYIIAILFSLQFDLIPEVPYSNCIIPGVLCLVFILWQWWKAWLFHGTAAFCQVHYSGASLFWKELWIPVRHFFTWMKYKTLDRRMFMRR